MIRSLARSGIINFAPTRNAKSGSIGKSTVSGGTEYIVGDWVYRKFTSSGTLTISDSSLNCDLLIVAGGGGGGDTANTGNIGGGGGGGGVLALYNQVIAPGSLSVTVGAGGARAELWTYARGSSGNNSSVAGFTTAVGGGAPQTKDSKAQTCLLLILGLAVAVELANLGALKAQHFLL